MNINDINMSQLKYFCDVIESKSFTVAARMNHVSRPAISQALKKLEDTVGYQLLFHKKNNLILTGEGELFLKRAQKLLLAAKYFLHSEQQIADKVIISFGISYSLFEAFFLQHRMDIDFSRFHFEIKFGTTSSIREMLERERVSFAMVIDDNKNEHLEKTVLFSGAFKIYGQSNQLLKNGVICTELREEVSILKSQFKKCYGEDLKVIHQIESWTGALAMAKLKMTPCLVPDFLDVRPLKQIETQLRLPNYDVVLLTKDHSKLLPSQRELLNKILKIFIKK